MLEPTDSQAAILADTYQVFTSAFNQAVALGWQTDVSNATKLHYLAYYPVKEAHPTLVSDLINQARVKAAEVLRSAFAWRKDAERTVSQPQSPACPPRYNTNTYRVDWESRTVRLSTTGGRQTLRFRVPTYARIHGLPDRYRRSDLSAWQVVSAYRGHVAHAAAPVVWKRHGR